MKNTRDKIQSYVSSPQSLISFIKNSSDHWLIKDREARYIFVNDPAFEFFRFPKNSIRKENLIKKFQLRYVKNSGQSLLKLIKKQLKKIKK
ncbi:hypothetical protein CJJ19_11115 (plasmid) [Candidatus Williamhamiltonella defendens]|nr:hypothetical protein CJJ19_11115 [Candidatus Hamiltonella defensa]